MRVIGIKTLFNKQLTFKPFIGKLPYRTRQAFDRVFRQAQRLTYITDRSFLPFLCNRGNNSSTVTAIFYVNVLFHLFPTLMLKVYVNIWWFIAGFRHKTNKKQPKQG